ncbi:MAG: hypothetical protein JNK30_12645 [Phenylobacterium sp.]|uniref:hypothetical protein n=1 Tax=Phenylobacterium sp. TaxID=1871053 RepID=UPI001A4C85E6|nr:hypothetical protein [Phenylobacterium sp.]MBL8772222.1 hypothetical protein [Phenylobacterium sp.]
MPSQAASSPPRRRSVFINCPFDAEYKPLFRAMCFAIAACGFAPRCALDESDSAVVRFDKILDLITACEFSVHDVSRVELDTRSGLPRFNMPLELGADLGLRLKGPAAQRKRRILVLDAEAHRYDQTLSDISGMDIEAHGNDAARLIKAVRDWLNAGRDGGDPLPGSAAIVSDYTAFQALVPDIIARLRLDDFDAIPHTDYMHLVELVLSEIEKARDLV